MERMKSLMNIAGRYLKIKKKFKSNQLDIHFEDNEFTIMSFTERTEVNDFDLNLITRWLAEKYPEVCKSYEAARKHIVVG